MPLTMLLTVLAPHRAARVRFTVALLLLHELRAQRAAGCVSRAFRLHREAQRQPSDGSSDRGVLQGDRKPVSYTHLTLPTKA